MAMVPSSPSITAPVSSLESRGVRFDDECILIPDPQPRSRMPKLLAKPSSFIFKRKQPQDLHSPTSFRDCDPPQSPTSPRPALSRKFSLNEGKPPAPIQRRSSLPPPPRNYHTRTTSLPPSPLVTIPLRPCCPNCFPATEGATLQSEESFSRAARRRHNLSTDSYLHSHPCPPHVLSSDRDSGSPIRWSAESPPATAACHSHSVVVMDEDECKAELMDADDMPAPASDDEDQKLSEVVRRRLDRLSVAVSSVREPPEDDILPHMLSRHRHGPWLPPIPSNNLSADDLSPTSCAVTEETVDILLHTCNSPTSGSFSPPASPLPQTPSSVFSTPRSSPTISSPSMPTQKEGESPPRIPSSFRIPKGSSLLRAGSDILKGVSVFGTGPI
ncbi:hypothetical protein BJV74DRAFT_880629 [Russula compacta]|nr:hypothetical protein BJV74DRAFT_880629 [Russula compacta]